MLISKTCVCFSHQMIGLEHQQTDERSVRGETGIQRQHGSSSLPPWTVRVFVKMLRQKAFSLDGRGPFLAKGISPGSCRGWIQAAHSIFLLR